MTSKLNRGFRFLFKWGLQITGGSIIAYHCLGPQKQADVDGFFRSMVNTARFSSIVAASVFDYWIELREIEYNSQEYHDKRSEIHTRVAKRILELSEVNKGVYMKLGQYLGNLQRVVPWQFTKVLGVLQDSAPPIPYDEIKVIIEEDLKMKPKEIFDTFDKKAIAAASLAQVHKAVLNDNFRQVAIKLQYPFLEVQSKYDLIAMEYIVQFLNSIMQYGWNNKQIDVQKLYNTWKSTIQEQLNFQNQIQNGKKMKRLLKNNPYVHIPHFYEKYSSKRIIVMEYVEGAKINEVQKIQKLGINPKIVANNLVNIFSHMIFKHGYIHCDAHPGNILVRKAKNSMNHQIVLLDHGLYRSLPKETIQNFSQLWRGLITSDRQKVYKYGQKLKIQKHVKYLPIIFLFRTVNSQKKIGDPITSDEKKYFRQKDIANLKSINEILQDLPPDIMFIIKATNLISTHNFKLGGTHRNRIMNYTKMCLQNCEDYSSFTQIKVALRVWLFENFYGMYRWMFGTLS